MSASIDLGASYLDLTLRSPIVASASPLTGEFDVLQRLDSGGAGAAVLPSLFEEQLVYAQRKRDRSSELSYIPALEDYNRGVKRYLRLIERAKSELSMPIIASLNGATPGGWGDYPRQLQDAGADAVELDIYFVPTHGDETAADVEDHYLRVVDAVRGQIDVPLAVKIGPYFTSLVNFANRLVFTGANGLVLFNRYLEPDVDLHRLMVEPRLTLSGREELRTPLRWLGVLHGRLGCSLAATSGVHTADDVLKALSAGANVAMIASVLMRRGVEHLPVLLDDLRTRLSELHCASVRQLIGCVSREQVADASAYERANYLHALISYLDQGAQKSLDDPATEGCSDAQPSHSQDDPPTTSKTVTTSSR